MLNQIGISPKVLGPFLLSCIGAALLWMFGDKAQAQGVAMAAALHLTAGYALPPGGMTVGGSGNAAPDLPDLAGLDAPEDGDSLPGTNPPTGAPAPTQTGA